MFLKNIKTNMIAEFSMPQGGDWVEATEQDMNTLLLAQAKTDKKALIEANYKQSKQNCQIVHQNQSYSRSNGFENMLQLCLQWKSSSQTVIPSLNISVSVCTMIYDKLLLLRDEIANNVEITKQAIDAKETLDEVNNYTTNLKILFDAEVKIEDLL